jgi:hypothetical protein
VPSLVVITRPDSCHASAWDLNRLSSSSRPSRARTQISGRGWVASDAAVLVSRRSRRPATRCSCQAIRPRGAAVESDEPPAFLRLGNDALRAHRRLATARLDTIQTWEYLPTSTDIDI